MKYSYKIGYTGDEVILPCDVRKFDGWKLKSSLAIIWQNCKKVLWKLTIMFLNTETFSGRTLRNKIYMRGLLNVDLELL